MPFKDPKKRKRYNREYRKKNKVRLSPIDAAYRKKHRKRIAKYLRKWRLQNPGYEKTWRAKNRKKKCANQKRYYQKNPGKAKIWSAIRATRITKAGGRFTEKQWLLLCKKYKYRCLRCRRRRHLTPDHVVPISKGGTSNIENIQPLCGPCNSSKNTKTIDYRGAA
jgi:5-methylcytosine-specific restriction endonuclease McrA